MWSLLKQLTNNEKNRKVRIGYECCNRLPVQKQQVTDTVKSWDNEGLVYAFQNGAIAMLTKKGQEVKELKQYA